jgi:hypothetical protein
LVEYVSNSNPVRVGWAIGNMMHWANGSFVTVINNQVFAQIRPINQQGQDLSISGSPGIFSIDLLLNSWVAIIGTIGDMNQKSKTEGGIVDSMLSFYPAKEKDKIMKQIKKMKIKKVATKWAVLKK